LTQAPATSRRGELDALRSLVVVGLVFFHAALVFDARDDFYVKNDTTTEATTILAGLGVVWAMPLLFVVAGIGAWHSLRKRSPGGFAAERLLRLGVPLVFATLTIVPVPQYLRLRADPAYDEAYPRFLLRFFDVRLSPGDVPFVVQGELFETGHLWFIVLLLTFSLVLAAAVRWAPAVHPPPPSLWTLAALAVPVAVICAAVGLEEGLGAWSRWAYLLFFLYGFLLASDDAYRPLIRRTAPWTAGLGALFFLAGAPAFLSSDDPFTEMSPLPIGARALFGLAGWCCVLAILGFLDRPRSASGGTRPRKPAYLATASLPLYVLHQPIVVAVAFTVVRWELPAPLKYLIIVVVSLGVLVAAYDLLVRRTRVTRLVFGMRGKP